MPARLPRSGESGRGHEPIRLPSAARRREHSIPKGGAIVVTLTGLTGEPLKELIRVVHDAEVLKRCHFVSANRRGDETKLEGLVGQVVSAHCFRLRAPVHLVARAAEAPCGVMVAAKVRKARPATRH